MSTVYVDSFPTLYLQLTDSGEESRVKEEELVARRLKKLDPETWSRLYEEYFPRIYRYVVLRVTDRMEAEDLTEQVFLNALEAGPSFRWRGAPVSSWLFRIARNKVIDYKRTDKSKKNLPLYENIVSDDENPEKAAERNSDVRQLIQAVSQLTRAQRDVIELRFAGGLSVAEVARILGKSQGAVKVMQHSAIVSLRAKLAGMRQL